MKKIEDLIYLIKWLRNLVVKIYYIDCFLLYNGRRIVKWYKF